MSAAGELPPPESITDLVWIATGFLGDLVLATAAMRLAARTMPRVRQHVITTAPGLRIFDGLAEAASVHCFAKRDGFLAPMRAVARDLKTALAAAPGERRILTLQAHRSARSSLLAAWLGYPVIAYEESPRFPWGRVVRRVPRVAVLHEAARIGLLLEPLGVPRAAVCAARPHLEPLPLSGGDWQATLAERRAAGAPVLAVAPGSVWGTKRWLPGHFGEVVTRVLSARPDALVVLLGSGAEKPAVAALTAALPAALSSRVLDLAGRTDLTDLRRIYPCLTVLLSNDSSPVHYAAAFGVPTVAVFGATVPGMGFGPLAPRSRVFGVDGLDCRPCSDHGPATCPRGHFRCMRELAPAPVAEAVLSLLGAPRH